MITHIQGKLIETGFIQNLTEIITHNLDKGIYFLIIENKSNKNSIRFIVE